MTFTYPLTRRGVQRFMRDLDAGRNRSNQIVMALSVYRDRSELDGTVETAIACLLGACYEVVGYEQEEIGL